jgi:hypothetical protein
MYFLCIDGECFGSAEEHVYIYRHFATHVKVYSVIWDCNGSKNSQLGTPAEHRYSHFFEGIKLSTEHLDRVSPLLPCVVLRQPEPLEVSSSHHHWNHIHTPARN